MKNKYTKKTWEQAVELLRRHPEQQQFVIDCYYDDPLTSAANRYWHSEEWKGVQQFLPPNKGCALDVGAGRGIASYALARDGFSVVALEPDPSPIVGAEAIRTLARECALDISVTETFSEQLPFENEQFDLIFIRAVLHHTSDLPRACREFYRVLKPKGRLIAVREHVISHQQDLDKFLENHPLHRLYGGENAFLLEKYKQSFKEAGFVLHHLIAPFDSSINFSPRTLHSLQEEIAQRLPFRKAVMWLLAMPPVWRLVRALLRRIDNRPGRLYSFVVDKA